MFKKIMVLLVLFTSLVLSQSWNDIKTTDINVANANAEMFSNSFGNNVILQNTNGSITYYVVNASTGLAGNAITVVGSGASLAQITGEVQKVYVIYKNNSTNKIAGKFTTDAGANWTSIAELNVNPTTLDAVAYDGKIHITYTQNNITHYYQYYNGSWINYKNVSDSQYGFGSRIEMLTTQSKVYVVFNSSSGSAKSRELTLPSSWASVQNLYSNVNQPKVAGFGVDANYMYLYYSDLYNISPYFYNTFHTNIIQKSNYQTVSYLYESYNYTDFVQTTTTADNKVHTAYTWFGILGDGYQSLPLEPGLVIQTWNNGNIEGENVEVNYNYEYYSNVEISSTSNDIFVLWKPASSSIMKYRQFDAVPLAPQNFQITSSGSPSYHPVLSWNQLIEPDVRIKSNGLRVERSLEELGQWGAWSEIAAISGSGVNYTDSEIFNATGAGNGRVKYRIRSYDDGGHFSPYSNEITIRFGTSAEKIVVLGSSLIEQYSLDQNYPNPFNPSTKIIYSIKEEGLVTLKVYDILGKEIATLVNENKPEGIYEVEFSATGGASLLPSGMYIYKIQSGSFTDVKKMLLTK